MVLEHLDRAFHSPHIRQWRCGLICFWYWTLKAKLWLPGLSKYANRKYSLEVKYIQGLSTQRCSSVTYYYMCAQLCLTLCNPMDCSLLSIGFSRQGYWSGLPFHSPRDLPDPGIEPTSLGSPALAGGFFTTSAILHTPSKNACNKCSFEEQVLMEFEKDFLFPW